MMMWPTSCINWQDIAMQNEGSIIFRDRSYEHYSIPTRIQVWAWRLWYSWRRRFEDFQAISADLGRWQLSQEYRYPIFVSTTMTKIYNRMQNLSDSCKRGTQRNVILQGLKGSPKSQTEITLPYQFVQLDLNVRWAGKKVCVWLLHSLLMYHFSHHVALVGDEKWPRSPKVYHLRNSFTVDNG